MVGRLGSTLLLCFCLVLAFIAVFSLRLNVVQASIIDSYYDSVPSDSGVVVSERCASCDMRFNNTKYKEDTKYGINGVFSSEGYYCVWVKDRSPSEIASTEVHEQCHALINKDRGHFCG